MQTKGQQQFRINRQVGVTILICLIALALPLASIIFGLQSLTRKQATSSQSSESELSLPLRSMLEGIADEKLTPEDLQESEARLELIAPELPTERARIEQLLANYGGVAIPRLEDGAEIRLLVQVPEQSVEDFLAACGGGKERGLVGDLSGGLFELVIKKIDSQ